MEVGRRLRRRDRRSFWFKRSELQPPPSPTSSGRTTLNSTPTHSDSEGYTYDDQRRATRRYIEAVRILEEALQEHGSPGAAFDELSGEPRSYSDSLFRERINATLEAQRNRVQDDSILERCKHTIQCAFTAFSPFAKNFLNIAKEALSVSHAFYAAYRDRLRP
jgi:hypothetical protein